MKKRINNLEFRAYSYSDGTTSNVYELIKWLPKDINDNSYIQEYCITVAFFNLGREGCTISFVGDRPFASDIDHDVLWELLRFGQTYCDAEIMLNDNTCHTLGDN